MTAQQSRLAAALTDRYTLLREIGAGGMATVYLARDLKHDRQVALKVLRPDLAAAVGAERFPREIKLVSQFQHPHILALHDSGEAGGFLYYVMPYVEGESLADRLGHEHQLPVNDVVRILKDVADALAYAHARGVVHRDIKPGNVLLTGRHAVVTDFGVAKALATSAGDRITTVGIAVGTPAYMAPEQATGQAEIDARADLYALGILGYEMLAGRLPFKADTAQGILAAHIVETPQDIRELRTGIPAPLADLLMRCLAKDPAHRPESATALVQILDGIGTPSGNSTVAAKPYLRRNLAIAAALLLLVAAGLWAVRRAGGGPAVAATPTLAVLPIENVGSDSTKEYLADGMTSELAGDLRQTPGLQVVGDLSTNRFRHSQLPPTEIARQLGVGLLLTGNLQSQGDRIRLQMQLTDASGRLLWSNRYERAMKDNFAMQDEITGAVVGEMRLVLSPMTVTVARAGRTENPEAHDMYLRGVFEKNKLSEAGLRRSLIYFQEALKLDSGYARAHAGMAFAYDMLADAYAPSHEYHVLAEQAAERALQSDSLLAEARVIHGFETAAARWDFPAGLAEMRRGLALNPNSTDALFMYGTFLTGAGQGTEGRAVTEQLIRLDPLSAMASLGHSLSLYFMGQWPDALRQDSVTKRLDPTVVYFDAIDGAALRELGHLEASVTAYLDYQRLTGQPAFGLAMTYARMGRRADAVKVVQALEERARRQWVDPTFLAAAYSAIGDQDHGIAWLETAFRERAFPLRLLMNGHAPWFRSLESDPRFPALRARVLATTFND